MEEKSLKKEKVVRQTADERRATILKAAVSEFALYGLYGASTENIAKRAGISQPYIFRLFGTKKELFLATCELVFKRIQSLFRAAAEANPADPTGAMGHAYDQLLGQREELLVLLHSYAAAADQDVQQLSRQYYEDIFRFVASTNGTSNAKAWEFMAFGLLLTVATALNLQAFSEQKTAIEEEIFGG